MQNLPQSIGVIILILTILYFMFRGEVDRKLEKGKYHAVGGIGRIKRWVFGGSRGY